MSNKIMLKIAIQYPEIYALALVREGGLCVCSRDLQSPRYKDRVDENFLFAKLYKKKTLRKILELAIITFAMWLYPDATWAVTLVKFCFLALDLLAKKQDK